MKKELDPKVVTVAIASVVVIAGGVFFFKTRTPGDRSGPQFKVDFSKSNMKPRRGLMPPGWRPGAVQGAGANQTIPGASKQ